MSIRREVDKIARQYGHDPDKVMAVVEVESAGRVFWSIHGEKLPVIRPEGHYFYRLLRGSQRHEAIRAGLAWPKYSPRLAPRTWSASWATFRRMQKINNEVAIMSCSWGLGQVMGSDFRKLGFSTASDFMKHNFTAEGQLDIMMRYVDADGLRGALARGGRSADSWRPFARGYNGPAYARLGYHRKMARAYKKHQSSDNTDQIKDIQYNLKKAGYYKGKVDGVEYMELTDAIKKFQLFHGLESDGLYGPITARKMAEVLSAKNNDNADNMVKSGGGAVGVGAIGEKLINEISPLQHIGGEIFSTFVSVVITIGLLMMAYGIYKRYKYAQETDEIEAREEILAVKAEENEYNTEHDTEASHGTIHSN